MNNLKKTSKSILFLMLIVFTVVGVASISYAAEKKGYVELGVLFDKYDKTKMADEELAKMAKDKQTQRDNLVTSIRRMKDELVLLAEDGEEKIKKQSEIDKKLTELQKFDENTRTELGKIRDEKVKLIFDELNNAIQDYAVANKYDFIYSDRALIYKNEKYNITDEVLESLKK